MPKVIQKNDIRVVVQPRSPGDFGSVSISGIKRSESETIEMCEFIAADIRRHVDGLQSRGNRGVEVTWDDVPVCGHCGSDWTGESAIYNGGCCSKDDENAPADEAEHA